MSTRKSQKQSSPERKVQVLAKDIRQEIARWLNHRDYGCSDPFYADGLNMNLIRNHVLYDKGEIDRLCEAHGLPVPPERYIETPPEVPDMYFAGKASGQRWQRLCALGDRLVTSRRAIPHYDPDEGQLSLF
jgi:hypothetical protein